MMRKSTFPYKRIAAFCDKGALSDNLKALKEQLPGGVRFCAVVKADAYGHGFAGLQEVFERYADQYAVASVEEGETLRSLGIEKPILILGDVHPDEYPRVLDHQLSAPISTAEEAEELSGLSQQLWQEGRRAHVQIAVDTGMSRIGLPADESGLRELRRIARLPGITIDGIFTHFATADESNLSRTHRQLAAFQTFLSAAEAEGIATGVRHCANSAAILNGIGIGSFDMVRGGIAMYGLYPSDEVRKEPALRPVMQLGAYLTHVKEISEGTEVSYGGLFHAVGKMRVGTVSCGYADGYPRSAGSRGTMEVLVHGQRCPIIGRICMDQLMIDLSEVPDAVKGDPVTLIGRDGNEEISFYELAEKSGGFHYELLCGISKRVPRCYCD